MELNVSNIQHFSVGDGPGIRTTVFLKGCNLCCPWCHNPETWSPVPQTLYYAEIGKEEVCGRMMTVEDILEDVLGDKDFYDESDGGVTVSGGEPMLQAEGVAHLAKALRERGVSVLIDTAGSVPYAAFEKVAAHVDGYLFDYKTDEREKYAAIGGDIGLIRDNIRNLIKDGANVRIRIPLIPDINTSGEAAKSICRTLAELGVTTVDLIPFHRLGSGKYGALGRAYPYAETPLIEKSRIGELREIFSEYFQTSLDG